jgi:myosin-crossreactive antigen
LEKPIGAKFTSNKKVVVNEVVANKRSVKSENEDLIVTASCLSFSRTATKTQTKATKQRQRGGDEFGEKGSRKERKEKPRG